MSVWLCCFSLFAQTPALSQTNFTTDTNLLAEYTNALNGPGILQAFAADVKDYEQHPENWQGEKLIYIANGYVSEANFEQAIVVYKKLLAVQPTNAAAMRGLGNCYYLTKNNEAAAAQYKQGWALGDDLSLAALANLYGIYTRQYQELKPWIPDLIKVRSRTPNTADKLDITNNLLLYSLSTSPPENKEVFLEAMNGLSDELILQRKDTSEIVIHCLKVFGYQERADKLTAEMKR